MFAPVLKAVFRKDQARSQAETLYAAIAEQSRRREFHLAGGAPDTPEGRFDMLALHMFLAIDRLKRDAPATDRVIRRLQEAFFERLDSALREMGVGDLSVGRKIRGLAEAFYGRLLAYEKALREEDGDALAAAIARNVHGREDAKGAAAIADYVRAARADLRETAIDGMEGAIGRLCDLSQRIVGGGAQ